jgi:glycosyltransferase involved in cell wall biosynthesis
VLETRTGRRAAASGRDTPQDAIAARPLAIFVPQVGARSEIFIRRRIENLLPDGTVVVAGTVDGPSAGHWTVACPLVVLNRLPRPTAAFRAGRAIARKLGWGVTPHHDTVRSFLLEHGVRVVVGDYLEWALRWLDLAHELGLQFFGYAHGYDVSQVLRDPKWARMYLRYNEADGVIVPSRHGRDRLIEAGIDSQRIHVVPSGVPVPSAPMTREETGCTRCLAVGRMVPKKAPLLTLKAFRQALGAHPQMHLDVVGDGDLLAPATQFVHDSGLDSTVTFHGSQPNEMVNTLMRQADLFLQHSITDPQTGDEEGLPTAIQEAMACSLPVVSTCHAGIPEAVDDGTTGFLVREGDTDAMAERIVRLAGDHGLRQRMGEAAWRRAQERFAWPKSKAALLRILGFATDHAGAGPGAGSEDRQ